MYSTGRANFLLLEKKEENFLYFGKRWLADRRLYTLSPLRSSSSLTLLQDHDIFKQCRHFLKFINPWPTIPDFACCCFCKAGRNTVCVIWCRLWVCRSPKFPVILPTWRRMGGCGIGEAVSGCIILSTRISTLSTRHSWCSSLINSRAIVPIRPIDNESRRIWSKMNDMGEDAD